MYTIVFMPSLPDMKLADTVKKSNKELVERKRRDTFDEKVSIQLLKISALDAEEIT